MRTEKIVLAGGGHSHALLLRSWAMRPHTRPSSQITLINRRSTTFYSGMIPGLISGHYSQKELEIDLRSLTRMSGVSLVIGEIVGLDLAKKQLLLADRPPKEFDVLSLDVGSETYIPEQFETKSGPFEVMPIRPLEAALDWLKREDNFLDSQGLTVIGSGLAAVEVALALRNRWPDRLLSLSAYPSHLSKTFIKILEVACVEIVSSQRPLSSSALLCTGSKAPDWLAMSGLAVDVSGRILTSKTLQVIDQPSIFAVGDCGVIQSSPRPPSGVWAVRSAQPLAQNLELLIKGMPLKKWAPQKYALKIIGFQSGSKSSYAIAIWRGFTLGPFRFLWWLKKTIDLHFISLFKNDASSMTMEGNECRGCASKLSANTLKAALNDAGLSILGSEPKDAVDIDPGLNTSNFLQSVDGFPALVSDSWLNGRITALHASSDLWASGADLVSAQSLVVLPKVSGGIQQELLAETLQGIQSALDPQEVKLIGGHTFEARSNAPKLINMGLEVSLAINGKIDSKNGQLRKGPLLPGDALLISRPIGIGVLFAADMVGEVSPSYIENALNQLSKSQYSIFKQLMILRDNSSISNPVHACTDVTGFGLLGHLAEMIKETSKSLQKASKNYSSVRVILKAADIPSLPGSLSLFERGYSSTLAPSNRSFWGLLEPSFAESALVELSLGEIPMESSRHKALKELIVDPQTCGPLMISCDQLFANDLLALGNWYQIGYVI